MYKNYDTSLEISSKMINYFYNYYINLYKTKKVQTITEVSNGMDICLTTLNRCYNSIGLEFDPKNINKIFVIILTHTNFTKASKYYNHKLECEKYFKKMHIVEELKRRKHEKEELYNSRKALVKVLNQVVKTK